MTREHFLSCNDSDADGQKILPERALLWGFLQRALEDLDLRKPELLKEVRSAICWFRGSEHTSFTYTTVIEELELSGYILKKIAEKVDRAESYTDAEARKSYDKWKTKRQEGGIGSSSSVAESGMPYCTTYTTIFRN